MISQYTAKQLRSSTTTLKELAQIGSQFGLAFTKNINKAKRAEMILAAQATPAADHTPDEDATKPTDGNQPSAKPAFEAMIDGRGTALPDPPSDQRGGERPGAGRPLGMTAEHAAMNRLSQQPHPFVKSALEILFNRWAASVKCSDLALTKDEAFDLALAWTQVGDYLGVTDKIPMWLQLAITAIWTTANIVASKAAVAREFREKQKPEPVPEAA